MVTLTFSNSELTRVLQQAMDREGQDVIIPAGINHLPGGVEIMAISTLKRLETGAVIAVSYSKEPPFLLGSIAGQHNQWLPGTDFYTQLIFWGEGDKARIYALTHKVGGKAEEVAGLKVVGSGMPYIRCSNKTLDLELKTVPERWSRLIGSVGLDTWENLCQSRFAIIGCGRSGSLIATALARFGVRNLCLIDPDYLETHNLDAMDGVHPGQEGQPKVEALKAGLLAINPNIKVETIPYSVTALKTLSYLKESDVICTCTDDDGARWTAAVIASLYLKPVIDIGTGVMGHDQEREMGADIRLVLPGEGCLACFGGFSRPGQIAVTRRSALEETRARQERDWRQERAGSLRSLNQIATGLALRMLEDLYGAQLEHSQWLRLNYRADAKPEISELKPANAGNCPICRLRGLGDAGLSEIARLPGPEM